MSEPANAGADDATGNGQRRPKAEDIPAVLELVSNGESLRGACRALGLHTPSTHTMIDRDDGLREQYARARELRADCQQEEALEVARAAAVGGSVERAGEQVKVDPQGARVLLDAIKWTSARMAPKTAPVERHHHTFGALSDEELAARIASMEGREPADD